MDEVLKVALTRAGAVPVVVATGEVDVATAPLLREQLEGLDESENVVVVDLSDVTFIDSTGIGVLVAALKRIREAQPDGSLRLIVTRPHIVKVLEVTGLSEVFSISATREEAVRP